VTIHRSRPVSLIGKKGRDIDKTAASRRADITHDLTSSSIFVADPKIARDLDATWFARIDRAAARKQCRVPPRDEARRASAMGWALEVSASTARGPFGGAEIARMEWYREAVCAELRCAPTAIRGGDQSFTHSALRFRPHRLGYERAKSSSTIVWPRTRRWAKANHLRGPAATRHKRNREVEGAKHMMQPKKTKSGRRIRAGLTRTPTSGPALSSVQFG